MADVGLSMILTAVTSTALLEKILKDMPRLSIYR
jgi:hypothetical protein